MATLARSDIELFQLGIIPEPPVSTQWKIIAKHRDCDYYEEVDSADSAEEADYLVGEYALAFGREWHVDVIEPPTV